MFGREQSERMIWFLVVFCFALVAWPSYHCGYKNGWNDGRDPQWGRLKKRKW